VLYDLDSYIGISNYNDDEDENHDLFLSIDWRYQLENITLSIVISLEVLHENSLNCVTCYIKAGFFIIFVLTFHCSSDFLDPL